MARIGRAAIAGLLLIRSSVSAQDVTEPALKAAFIYNFAKFTEWPADALPQRSPSSCVWSATPPSVMRSCGRSRPECSPART